MSRMDRGSKKELLAELADLREQLGDLHRRLAEKGSQPASAAAALREAEGKLEHRHATLNSMVESSSEAIFALDRQYRYTAFNSSHAQMMKALFGEDIRIGMNILDCHRNPADRRVAQENLDRALRGEFVSVESCWGDDGFQRRLFSASHNPIRLAGGEITGVAVFARDLAQRKQAEESLRASEARYRLISENTADVIWTMDLASRRLTFLSPSVHRLRGFTAEEAMAQPLADVLTPESCAFVAKAIPERLAASRELGGPGVWTDQLDTVHKDGSVVHTEVVSTLLSNDRGQPDQILGVTRNITGRRRAEESLRASEARFRRIFEHSASGMALASPDLCFLRANGEFCRMLGYAESELLGRSFQDVTLPEDRAVGGELARRVLSGEMETFHLEKRYLHKNGIVVWGLVSSVLIRDAQNNPLHFVTQVQDITERKRTESALHLSEEKFRSLFENAEVGMLRMKLDGSETLDVNSRFLDILGRSREEIEGRPSAHHWADPREREEMIRQLQSHDRVSQMECRMLNKRGEVRNCLASLRLYPEQGTLEGSIIDITDRKQAEQSLRESEERYRSLVEHIGLGVVLIGSDYRIRSVNPAQARLLGKPQAEFVGKECFREFEKRGAVCPHCAGKRAMATGLPAEAETLGIPNGGPPRRVRLQAYPVMDSSGRPAGFVDLVQDITERKQAEESLRDSEERFRALVESAPEAIFVQCQGRFAYLNPAMLRLLGASRAEVLIGTDSMDHVAPEYREAIRERIRRQRETGKPSPLTDLEWVRLDGSRVPVETTGVAIRFQGREAHLVFVRDVTERNGAEEEKEKLQAMFLQAQKMEAVGRLAAGVAHDFNNQLTVILGYSEMLLGKRPESDPLWEPLTQIRQAAGRAQSTTSHLLSFSRKQVLQPEAVDLGKLLEEMRAPVSRMLGEDIALTVAAPSGLPAVEVDRSGMQQAVMNLAVNARDAMPRGGRLLLRASGVTFGAGEAGACQVPGGTFVLLEVVDSGVGMDRQTLERVFEPFFTTKEKGKGTGLGMSMVHGFVSQSRGVMRIDSEPGKGTTVRLLLPPAHQPAPRERGLPSRPTRAGGARKTILVVEDEEGVRKFIVAALRQDGYEVLESLGPAQAMELFSRHDGRIDLLLTDIVMPDMTGDELARKLKAKKRSLRVLFMTGYADKLPGHGTKVLPKPVKVADLTDAVGRLLRRRASRRED